MPGVYNCYRRPSSEPVSPGGKYCRIRSNDGLAGGPWSLPAPTSSRPAARPRHRSRSGATRPSLEGASRVPGCRPTFCI